MTVIGSRSSILRALEHTHPSELMCLMLDRLVVRCVCMYIVSEQEEGGHKGVAWPSRAAGAEAGVSESTLCVEAPSPPPF